MVREVVGRIIKIREPNTFYQKIAVLRALQLGDLLCSVPAFRAIRAAQPKAEVSLIGLPWSIEFVSRFNHYLDQFIEFPGYPGLPERDPEINKIPGFIERMQAENFDLVIQMQGSGSFVNPLVSLFGAKQLAGFTTKGEYTPDLKLFIEYPSHEPEVIRMIRLVEHLGFAAPDARLEFRLDANDLARGQAILARNNLSPSAYICMHPGSRSSNRRWPVDRFAWVADRLAERGFPIVLTGVSEESNITREVAQRMEFPVIDLAGKTDLGSMGAIIRTASLIVCNDTGVSHIADALQKPSVVLFTGSDPARWAPIDQVTHRIIGQASSVDPETVLEEALALLQKDASYAT